MGVSQKIMTNGISKLLKVFSQEIKREFNKEIPKVKIMQVLMLHLKTVNFSETVQKQKSLGLSV
jgi:hypothetical protein